MSVSYLLLECDEGTLARLHKTLPGGFQLADNCFSELYFRHITDLRTYRADPMWAQAGVMSVAGREIENRE